MELALIVTGKHRTDEEVNFPYAQWCSVCVGRTSNGLMRRRHVCRTARPITKLRTRSLMLAGRATRGDPANTARAGTASPPPRRSGMGRGNEGWNSTSAARDCDYVTLSSACFKSTRPMWRWQTRQIAILPLRYSSKPDGGIFQRMRLSKIIIWKWKQRILRLILQLGLLKKNGWIPSAAAQTGVQKLEFFSRGKMSRTCTSEGAEGTKTKKR